MKKESSSTTLESPKNSSAPAKKETTSSPQKPAEPEKKEASPSPQKPAESEKKGSKKPLIILAIVVVMCAIVGVIFYLQSRNYESTDDAFVEGHVAQLSSKIAANILEVHFDDNQEVKKGDLLIELDPRDYEVALEKAHAELAQAQAQVLQAQAGVEQANAQLSQAEAQASQQSAQFEVANINFGRNNSLYQKDLRAVSKADVDSTKASLDAAKASLAAAQANVQATRSMGASAAAQVVAAQASVTVAQVAIHNAELQLTYTKIFAADSGRVTRKQVEPGNYVQPGQTLASLVSAEVWLTANFKETQLGQMKKNQPVEIKVDAFPKRKLKGHIESFQSGTGSRFSMLPAENATGNYVKVVQRVPVKIVFDESPEDLRRLGPGQSAVPTVDISSRQEKQ